MIYHSDKPSTSGDTSGRPHRQYGEPDPDRTRAIAVRVVPVAVALVPVLVLVLIRTVRAACRRVQCVRCALGRPLRRRRGSSGSLASRGHRLGGRGRVRAARLAKRTTRKKGTSQAQSTRKKREKKESGAPGQQAGHQRHNGQLCSRADCCSGGPTDRPRTDRRRHRALTERGGLRSQSRPRGPDAGQSRPPRGGCRAVATPRGGCMAVTTPGGRMQGAVTATAGGCRAVATPGGRMRGAVPTPQGGCKWPRAAIGRATGHRHSDRHNRHDGTV